ncbi:hypothetical protein HYT33_00240 [Candidatus Roizmanbacteria bacterium]|nr:hypothetical protein [Candidatus Roizmanbacteria bacterium]
MIQKNQLRYYYWLFSEFTKKHLKMILLSFFVSFFIIISLVSFSPYLDALFFTRKQVIGFVGNYTINTLPDTILEKISHGLVSVNERGEPIPALSSSWEMLKGGKEFRFHLKNDLVWDDGKDVSAYDLVYNFKDVEAKAIDKKTIYFILKKPLPIFPTYLTKPALRYPLHGAVGPYKVDRIKERGGVVRELYLSPNKKDLTPIVYKFYDNESKLIDAYKVGEINEMTIFKKNLADGFLGWKNTTISKSVDYSTVLTLFFNTRNPFLTEKEVRQAIALSLPREKLQPLGEPANSPIPPPSWAYNPDLKKPFFDLDLSKKNIAKYLKEKESTASAKLEFVTFYDYLTTAGEIDKNLKEIRLNTDLTLSNFSQPEQFDLLLAYWKIPNDPDQYFFWHSTQQQGNITHYKNVRIDKLLEDGRSTLSVESRKKHYAQFQKVLVDDLPAVFLYYPHAYTIKRK